MEKILCVDDEVSILNSQKRLLRKYFDVHVAENGPSAIKIFTENGPFAVVISDMNMPMMNGIKLLSRIRDLDPTAVRMMLTGDQDLSTAEQAVNEGNIFRFLRKPCPPESMAVAIKAAITQYELINAEREILQKTLNQTVSVLIDVLQMANPRSFARTSRITNFVNRLVEHLEEKPDDWILEVALLLFPLGCISIPENILQKEFCGRGLTPEEEKLYSKHSELAYEQIVKIPRMSSVADAIRYQERGYDGSGFPADGPEGKDLPLESRLLKIALDYDKLIESGHAPPEAIHTLKCTSMRYDGKMLDALELVADAMALMTVKEYRVSDLRAGMILAEDIITEADVVLATKGLKLTKITVQRLYSFSVHSEIKQPVKALSQ